MSTEGRRPIDGLLAEFEFMREGLRQDQRERQVFLGFALAASGTLLGLLVRPATFPSANQALIFVVIAAAVTIVAEVLTMRATLGVASAGVYLRIFVEPYVDGLAFQGRNRRFLENMDSRISASWGFAIAYLMLTFALALTWFSAHLSSPRGVWQSAIVLLAAVVSLGFTVTLWWTSRYGWHRVERAWEAVAAAE
jgi:hypothetical protein